MWVASTHSRAGLIKLEKHVWVFLWILHGLQSPRPHGDGTLVRPHKVSYKVSNRLQWYGNVLQKEDNDWVKKCMEYKVEASRQEGKPERTWREVVQKNCQARKLNREDAMDRSRWRKLIKDY